MDINEQQQRQFRQYLLQRSQSRLIQQPPVQQRRYADEPADAVGVQQPESQSWWQRTFGRSQEPEAQSIHSGRRRANRYIRNIRSFLGYEEPGPRRQDSLLSRQPSPLLGSQQDISGPQVSTIQFSSDGTPLSSLHLSTPPPSTPTPVSTIVFTPSPPPIPTPPPRRTPTPVFDISMDRSNLDLSRRTPPERGLPYTPELIDLTRDELRDASRGFSSLQGQSSRKINIPGKYGLYVAPATSATGRGFVHRIVGRISEAQRLRQELEEQRRDQNIDNAFEYRKQSTERWFATSKFNTIHQTLTLVFNSNSEDYQRLFQSTRDHLLNRQSPMRQELLQRVDEIELRMAQIREEGLAIHAATIPIGNDVGAIQAYVQPAQRLENDFIQMDAELRLIQAIANIDNYILYNNEWYEQHVPGAPLLDEREGQRLRALIPQRRFNEWYDEFRRQLNMFRIFEQQVQNLLYELQQSEFYAIQNALARIREQMQTYSNSAANLVANNANVRTRYEMQVQVANMLLLTAHMIRYRVEMLQMWFEASQPLPQPAVGEMPVIPEEGEAPLFQFGNFGNIGQAAAASTSKPSRTRTPPPTGMRSPSPFQRRSPSPPRRRQPSPLAFLESTFLGEFQPGDQLQGQFLPPRTSTPTAAELLEAEGFGYASDESLRTTPPDEQFLPRSLLNEMSEVRTPSPFAYSSPSQSRAFQFGTSSPSRDAITEAHLLGSSLLGDLGDNRERPHEFGSYTRSRTPTPPMDDSASRLLGTSLLGALETIEEEGQYSPTRQDVAEAEGYGYGTEESTDDAQFLPRSLYDDL